MERPGGDFPLESRLLVLVALSLWLLAGAASVWELLAMQSPDSPLRLGVLAGPIAQLRSHSFGLGALLALAAWLWPRLYPAGRARGVLAVLVGGALVHTGALWVAAARGLLAVQLFDPRADARVLLYARLFGSVLGWLGLLALAVRAARTLRREHA
jgi:hypothetical protein